MAICTVAICSSLIVAAGCVGGDDNGPAEGEGTDVNADMGDGGSTAGGASDSNSGANGSGPGEGSDAGEDGGGQGSPPAPAGN